MTVRYPCAICGRFGTADRMFFSRYTGRGWSCNDLVACDKRAVRRVKQQAKVFPLRSRLQSVARIDAVLAEREQSVELLRLG